MQQELYSQAQKPPEESDENEYRNTSLLRKLIWTSGSKPHLEDVEINKPISQNWKMVEEQTSKEQKGGSFLK